MMLLENKVAFVTGASRGIGKAIALEMAKSGADVAVCYSSSSDAAEDVCRQIRPLGRKAVPYRCDVSSMEQCSETVKAAVEEFGQLDILVNNAGITRDNLMLMMKEDDFDSVISTNLKGAFNMMKQAGAHFLKRKQGTIINISSVSGMMGNAGQVNYAAAKAGISNFTAYMATEVASKFGEGIRVNAIAPGFFLTEQNRTLLTNEDGSYTQRGSDVIRQTPFKRFGRPEELCGTIHYLISDAAAFVTGTVAVVDGGFNVFAM